MRTYNLIETLQLYVMNAETGKALKELFLVLKEKNIKDYLEDVMLLSSNFKEIEKKERLGVGKFSEEKNRINLALIKLLNAIENSPHCDTINLLETDDEAIGTAKRLELIESKLDFILHYIERNDDPAFYSFYESNLWHALEEKSKENITAANILDKEKNLNNYAQVIMLYAETLEHEINSKFFARFRDDEDSKTIFNDWDRDTVIDDLKGNNKDKLYKFLIGERKILSLNQMAEIILANIMEVKKNELSERGEHFYRFFHRCYKVKFKPRLVDALDRFQGYRVKGYMSNFIFTELEAENFKKDIIDILQIMQPKIAGKR